MITLRPQQENAKLMSYDYFTQGYKAVICCAPTGFGKTVLFADIVREVLDNGVPTMVICDRLKLIDQAKEKLNKNNLYPIIIDPDYTNAISNLYLASVDTLKNRKHPEVEFIIIDECHKRSFDKIVLSYKEKGTKVLGVTATPVRTGKSTIEGNEKYTGQLSDVYDMLFIASTITEQLECKYLVPALTTSAPMDTSDIKTTNTAEGLEYNQKDVFQKFNKPQMYAGCIDNYNKFSKGKKAIVFNVNVEHSKKMNEEFLAAGIPSAHIDSNTPKGNKPGQRGWIYKQFKLGHLLVLNNCGIATTGYDEPTIECVIINRCTLSLALYLQMCGRGGRPCHEIGKEHFIIIDQGSNYIKHAYWSTEREYFLDIERRPKNTLGVAPMINCEKCESFIPANSSKCPFCTTVQPKPTIEEELKTAEFVFLDQSKAPDLKKQVGQMSVEEMENYRVFKKYTVAWIARQLMYRGRPAMEEYATLKNYSKAWVDKQLSLKQDQRDSTLSNIWDFIKNNTHLSDNQIDMFVRKKMRESHSSEEIEGLMPDILQAYTDYKNKKIDADGNLIIT